MNSSSLSWICRTRSATKIHKCMYYSYPEKTNFSRTRVPTYYLQNVCPFSVNLRPQRSFMSRFIIIRGLPYMTSAVGGGRGVPKKQKKGTKSAELWQWQGGRGSKNPKISRTSYMEAPYRVRHFPGYPCRFGERFARDQIFTFFAVQAQCSFQPAANYQTNLPLNVGIQGDGRLCKPRMTRWTRSMKAISKPTSEFL